MRDAFRGHEFSGTCRGGEHHAASRRCRRHANADAITDSIDLFSDRLSQLGFYLFELFARDLAAGITLVENVDGIFPHGLAIFSVRGIGVAPVTHA